MPKTIDTWFAVVNPHAGSGKTLSKWRAAEPLLYEHGINYIFVTPETPSDSDDKIRTACRAGYRNFLAVGGDGTIHSVLNSIVSYVYSTRSVLHGISLADFNVAVLPIGSGNDWIRSHNLPNDLRGIIRLLADKSFAPQDVVKATIYDETSGKPENVAYMANIGGYSFDANVCDVVNFQKAHGVTGKLMYVKAVKGITFRQKTARTKIVCDGVTVFDDLLYTISVGNGRYSGGGLCQTPSAVMDDGLLDLMVAPKFPLWKVFFNIRKALNARTEEIKFLRFFRGAKVEIIPYGQGQLVEADGEIIGRAPVCFEVLPERINALHQPL